MKDIRFPDTKNFGWCNLKESTVQKKSVSRSREKTKEEQTGSEFCTRLVTQTKELREQRSELNLGLVMLYNCIHSRLVVSFLHGQLVYAAAGALEVCWREVETGH